MLLAQAVIFIFEHSEQGSAGLILNKPTQYTIGTMSGLEALCPEFNNNGLFLVRLPFSVDVSLIHKPANASAIRQASSSIQNG